MSEYQSIAAADAAAVPAPVYMSRTELKDILELLLEVRELTSSRRSFALANALIDMISGKSKDAARQPRGYHG